VAARADGASRPERWQYRPLVDQPLACTPLRDLAVHNTLCGGAGFGHAEVGEPILQ
jgi:hypothetical protein